MTGSGGSGSGGSTSSGGKTSSGGNSASGGSSSSGGAISSGGSPSSGGTTSTGGTSSGGTTGSGGRAGSQGSGGASAGTGGGVGSGGAGGALEKFSFFVVSYAAIKRLSKSDSGFGGDLRYGETGEGAGLRGADKICTEVANYAVPGSGAKGWKAFLSAPTGGPDGGAVNAIDRIGEGPWYGRGGKLFSMNKANLIGFRPSDADPTIKNDFPNEDGIGNHGADRPGCTDMACPDNHDTLTGSGADGKLFKGGMNPTCDGWTTSVGLAGLPVVGHAWPRKPAANTASNNRDLTYGHWMSSLFEAGCGAGVNLAEEGGPDPNDPTVGSGGGYGGFYCFALVP